MSDFVLDGVVVVNIPVLEALIEETANTAKAQEEILAKLVRGNPTDGSIMAVIKTYEESLYKSELTLSALKKLRKKFP